MAWCYSKALNVPVTLHLTADKMRGGEFGNKPESWAEILALFPEGHIHLQAHPVAGLPEAKWIAYLQQQGYPAEAYWFSDYPGLYDHAERIDASAYLYRIPLLTAAVREIALPDNFITVQWDSNQPKRRLAEHKRKAVMRQYEEQGYTPITIGGQAKSHALRWSLQHIAYAISKAAKHVGADSAFMHLAQLYLPPERIDLYNEIDGHFSHHAMRLIARGGRLNRYLT